MSDTFKDFWAYKKDPKRLEEVAGRMACHCGLQKPGSNRQKVVGPVAVVVGNSPREGIKRIYIHCLTACLVCAEVHRLAQQTEVQNELLKSLPELT